MPWRERRGNNRGLFAWGRIYRASTSESTSIAEIVLGATGYGVKGLLLLTSGEHWDVTIRIIKALAVSGFHLGILVSLMGLAHVLSIGTNNYRIRARVCTAGGILCGLIAASYIAGGRWEVYQIWTSYIGMALAEGALATRNWMELDRLKTMKSIMSATPDPNWHDRRRGRP